MMFTHYMRVKSCHHTAGETIIISPNIHLNYIIIYVISELVILEFYWISRMRTFVSTSNVRSRITLGHFINRNVSNVLFIILANNS